MVLKLRNVVLASGAALAALIPLYGDPRSAPITHPEWARMMLQGMDMEEALETSASASRVFSTLSWRESLWLRGGNYMRAEGVQVRRGPTEPSVEAVAELGEVVYPLTVVRRGTYHLRARLSGNPATPSIAQIAKARDAEAEESFTLVPATVPSWLAPEEGMELEPGTYYATFALPKGTVLEQFEIAPPCVTPVEPIDGWKPADILDAEDLAVTMIKALDRERDLPPADLAIEKTGSDFRLDEGQPVVLTASATSFDGLWLKAGLHGARATLFVDIPEDGLYSMNAFGHRGAGMKWLADDCRMSVLCPADEVSAGSEAPDWMPVLSAYFAKGRHFFSVALGRGAAIERVRIERKKGTGPDYVATLKRIGFDAGEGPVSRSKAADALDFLTKRYREELGKPCVILEPEQNPDTRVALQQGQALAQPGQSQPPVGPPPPVGGPPPVPPGDGPPSTLPCVAPGSPLTPDPCPSPAP